MIGLLVFIVFLVGAWVVLKFLIGVLVWPVVGELWFPLILIGVILLLYLLFRRR